MALYIVGGMTLYLVVTSLGVALGLSLHEHLRNSGALAAFFILGIAAAAIGIGGYMVMGLLP